jgi:hypothetical protein
MSNKAVNLAEAVQVIVDNNWDEAFVSVSMSHGGKVSVHVMDDYFDEHFGGWDVVEQDQPAVGNVKCSVTLDDGSSVFCLKKVEFTRVTDKEYHPLPDNGREEKRYEDARMLAADVRGKL